MNIFHTYISDAAKKNVEEVLDSTFLSAGKVAERFEKCLAEQLGLTNPVTVNSGTSALHLALAVAGIGPGDEVILSPQTFIATGLVILMQGATPVFADIQPLTGNIDPHSISAKITKKTKAIIPVHWGGYPCDLDEINELARGHHLSVIEDAAHAIGATYKGAPIGSISQFTAFSFQAIKHLTTGDGGALCCQKADDFYQAKRRRWFDIDREHSTPDILGERVYDAVTVGYKYHLNDLAAAIGLGNMESFPSRLARHREIGEYYREQLQDVDGITLLQYQKDRQSAYWLFTMLVEDRQNFIRCLVDEGIPASVVHLRIDKNSVFNGLNTDLEGQELFNRKQVSIPIHAGLTDTDTRHIVDTILKGW